MALDIAQMVAGAKFRGEFEERMKGVINDVIESKGQVILFVDEMHLLVGAGLAEGSMDASNMLKPALARGEMHLVGATTLNEYRKCALCLYSVSVFLSSPSIFAGLGYFSSGELSSLVAILLMACLGDSCFSDT